MRRALPVAGRGGPARHESPHHRSATRRVRPRVGHARRRRGWAPALRRKGSLGRAGNPRGGGAAHAGVAAQCAQVGERRVWAAGARNCPHRAVLVPAGTTCQSRTVRHSYSALSSNMKITLRATGTAAVALSARPPGRATGTGSWRRRESRMRPARFRASRILCTSASVSVTRGAGLRRASRRRRRCR